MQISDRRFLLMCAMFVVLYCVTLVPDVLRYAPLLRPAVARAAIQTSQELQRQGLWLINADLHDVTRNDSEICIGWEYIYRGRGRALEPRIVSLCTHE